MVNTNTVTIINSMIANQRSIIKNTRERMDANQMKIDALNAKMDEMYKLVIGGMGTIEILEEAIRPHDV